MPEYESGCEHCEILPKRFSGELDFYLSPPSEGTRTALFSILRGMDLPVGDYHELLLARPHSDQLDAVTAALTAGIEQAERERIRVLILKRGAELRLKDAAHMQSLDSLAVRISGDSVIQILHDGRLVTYVHPIVRCSESNPTFAYECLTRGVETDGSLIPPDRLFGVARRADLLNHLDRECRINSIRSAGTLAKKAKLFINFNPSSIYKPEYCLLTTMKALEEHGLTKEDVVFEIVESDRADSTEHLISILKYYRDQGFEVALDDLGAGYNSLNALNELRPDYVKLDIGLVRDVDRDPFKQAITGSLLTLAHELGIRTIAEGIERREEYHWIKEAGADFVQGYFFAKPAPVSEAPR